MSHTHRDYEPFEMGENMEEDVGLFQAAVQPRCESLTLPALDKILVADDQSNQSETVQRIAESLAARTGAELVPMLLTADAQGATAFQQIRSRAHEASLTILPVPFGEDISELASQSLGTVADMLLGSAVSPLLCVRQSMDASSIDGLWDKVLVAASTVDPTTLQATAWAFRLAKSRVVLVEWTDQESLTTAQQILQGRDEDPSIQQAVIGRAVSSRLGPLVGAAQRQATLQHIAFNVEFRTGNPSRQVLGAKEELHAALVVVGRATDTSSNPSSPLATSHFIEDLLRASRTPVLVV